MIKWIAVAMLHLSGLQFGEIELSPIAQDAAEQWAEAGAPVSTTPDSSGADITFHLVPEMGIQSPGLANVWWTGDGEIFESSILLSPEIEGERLLRSVVLHELGHSLGLPHIEAEGAVMFPVLNRSNDCASCPQELQPDDIAAIQALYGAPEGVPTAVNPSTSGSVKKHHNHN